MKILDIKATLTGIAAKMEAAAQNTDSSLWSELLDIYKFAEENPVEFAKQYPQMAVMVEWKDVAPTGELLIEVLAAVRADATIGSSTCSVISEAWTDSEIQKEVVKMFHAMTPRWRGVVKAYVNKFKEIDRIYNDMQKDVQNA